MKKEENKKVAVAMSGGVDSSVAAYLLREKGYDVVGFYMHTGVKVPERSRHSSRCSAEDARRVAEKLEIPFHAVDFSGEFRKIIDYFTSEYNRGRTPNPCIVCNRDLKFGKLVTCADQVGAHYFATGHHARVIKNTKGEYLLKKGRDKNKDQSYVLFCVRRQDLKRLLFPVGGITKDRVRAIAARLGLPGADKPDSQDICFVPNGDYHAVIREIQPKTIRPGRIVDESGAVLGEHEGYQFYTIGQRRGVKVAAGRPIYVVGIRPRTNEVVVGQAGSLYRKTLLVERVNWLAQPGFDSRGRARVSASIRYGHHPQPAWIEKQGRRWLLSFKESVRAVTPGQAAVFYHTDAVLGGGWISSTFPDE